MNKKQLIVVWESIKILIKWINLFCQGIWVKGVVRKLLSKNLSYIFIFPVFKKRLLLHPKYFFFKPSKNFLYFCEHKIQKAAEEILAYYGLERIQVKITHNDLEAAKDSILVSRIFRNNPPGKIYKLNSNQYTIYIDDSYHPEVIASILCHEISHAYLFDNGITFQASNSQKEYEEEMTDLTTIALGLGRLMIKGHFYGFREEGADYTGTVGYLKSGELRYAQALMELKIEQSNKKINDTILIRK